MTEET
jgi:hypothetical protein